MFMVFQASDIVAVLRDQEFLVDVVDHGEKISILIYFDQPLHDYFFQWDNVG